MEVVPGSPDTGARSNEPFHEVDATSPSGAAEGESSEEDSEASGAPSVTSSQVEEHNQHVAQAAFLLWLEGYNFDWTQLTEGQQDACHGMVGIGICKISMTMIKAWKVNQIRIIL